jgi:hypothetical protein
MCNGLKEQFIVVPKIISVVAMFAHSQNPAHKLVCGGCIFCSAGDFARVGKHSTTEV